MENGKWKMENGLQRTPILQKEAPKAMATRKEVESQMVPGQLGKSAECNRGRMAQIRFYLRDNPELGDHGRRHNFRWRLFPAGECWRFGATHKK